jgi:hypothetical protein
MSKVVLRSVATVATLAVAGFVSKALATAAQLTMNSVAVDQLKDSDAAFLKFTMFDWFMNSPWGMVELAVVAGVLYFIWKGQFKNV